MKKSATPQTKKNNARTRVARVPLPVRMAITYLDPEGVPLREMPAALNAAERMLSGSERSMKKYPIEEFFEDEAKRHYPDLVKFLDRHDLEGDAAAAYGYPAFAIGFALAWVTFGKGGAR